MKSEREDELEHENAQLIGQVDKLETDIGVLEDDADVADTKIAQLEAEIETLKEEVASLEWTIECDDFHDDCANGEEYCQMENILKDVLANEDVVRTELKRGDTKCGLSTKFKHELPIFERQLARD
jgi:chromosome segregation ATPase